MTAPAAPLPPDPAPAAPATEGRPTILAVLSSRGPGGTIVRRVLPAALLLPAALEAAVRLGTGAGLWTEGLGRVLFLVGGTALLAAVTVVVGATVDRLVGAREAAAAELVRSEAKYRALFRNTSNAFAYHRAVFEGDRAVDYVFLEVNEEFERLTGLPARSLLGRPVTEVFPGIEADPERLIERYGEVARTGRPARFDLWFPPLSRWYSVSAFRPLPGHFAVIFTDSTERIRAEGEVRRLNEALARRAAELAAANRELEAFAYSVSHDLRAPLRSIDGFAHALAEDAAGRLDETALEHLRRVRAAATRMGQLIDDLLALSRVSRTELRREPVDLSGLAAELAAELRERTPGRAVEVAIAAGLKAEADPRLLRILLENLLGNAWKFTAGKAPARIEVGAGELDGVPAFFVADDGAGFDMAHAGKLFGAFQRLHRSDEFPGNGIGLATVQRIARRHGGDVRAEGAVGRGARFTFTLRGADHG